MIRDITIHAVLNGFQVKVGCQTLVFTDVETLADCLMAYLIDPEKEEKDWKETAINRKHTVLQIARDDSPLLATDKMPREARAAFHRNQQAYHEQQA